MKIIVTTSIILDKRREKKNGKFPVKLCLNFITTSKYYTTRIDLTEQEFQALFAKRLSKESNAIKDRLHSFESQAKEIIAALKPFSFVSFERRFSQKPTHKGSLASLYQHQINYLNSQERLGTASSYQSSINSLLSFTANLSLEMITPDFLNDYEHWMIETRKASKTTVGIYVRGLRAIINESINQGLIPKEYYPFGKRKYQIPTGRNIKKALPISDIGKFYHFETNSLFEGEGRAKDFWLFSYFGNGINIKDIALLKFKNIQGEYIIFERAKTERTRRTDPKLITIYITDEMRQIMIRRCNIKQSDDDYIFPILEKGVNAIRKRKLIQQFTKITNKWTKHIAKKLEIPFNITTYTARHSFSTVLKRSGASTEFISEALGHSDVKTTENYLDSFSNDMKKQFALNLSKF